ncbi:hypothetical protein [Persicitalea sp.]|uniref:hypothetical protein n=1 Tax=Persicitalea sp. TaxID=3100273 RepID=UPI00359334EC
MSKSLALFFLFALVAVFSAKAQKAASVRTSAIVTSHGQKVDKSKTTWLTALYLRPVGQTASSRENWPLIPARLLEGTSTGSILTSKGPKLVRQVRKGSIVYRCEPGSQMVSTWEVRIVQRKARRVNASHASRMMDGSYLPDDRIAREH